MASPRNSAVRRTLLTALCLSIALVGCGETAPEDGADADDATEFRDTQPGDVDSGAPDVVEPDTELDSGSDLDAEADADDIEPCSACDTDAECGDLSCLELVDGSFCAAACDADECADGYACEEVDGPDGSESLCVPLTGVCSDCFDPDEDGYGLGAACLGLDCAEDNPAVNPGALELCDGIDNDCDEREDEDFAILSDLEHCGLCNNACDEPNALNRCQEGLCVVDGCAEGFEDCDGNDTCETNVADNCNTCDALENPPGTPCGTCGSGTYECDDPSGIVCRGDLGVDATNECGGCGELAEEIGSPCGDEGRSWTCNRDGELICPDGEVPVGAIIVTTADDALADDALCSLREAIESANTDTAVGGCDAGDGDDQIAIDSIASIALSLAGAGEDANSTGDLDVTTSITILGAVGGTTLDAAGLDRLFDVHEGGALELQDLILTNGSAQLGAAVRAIGQFRAQNCSFEDNAAVGGNGAQGTTGGGGGGGGGGLGGAVFSSGDVELSSCVFSRNSATGGDGARGIGNGGTFSGTGGVGGGENGGAGPSSGAGGAGGLAGGGGGGASQSGGTAGGAGGLGGGGGGGGASPSGGNTGSGGVGGFGGGAGGTGCCSASAGGGGGGGLGGAVYAEGGVITLTACTFTENAAVGGAPGGNHFGGPGAIAGSGLGGALLTRGASVTNSSPTYSGNTASTEGADHHDVP